MTEVVITHILKINTEYNIPVEPPETTIGITSIATQIVSLYTDTVLPITQWNNTKYKNPMNANVIYQKRWCIQIITATKVWNANYNNIILLCGFATSN